jgi:2-polyprenyl-6-methoxyphenol hydroxylase-like FAD-dependent oxidoreductase
VDRRGEHAVVIGASMGGLLAARVLSDAFERVTIVERDRLPAGVQARKGVPQGRHGHGLHPAGLRVLEELFPGFTAEVAGDGAPVFASTAIRGFLGGHELCRADMGAPLLSTSRPFLEGHVRRRVAALDTIAIVDGRDVVGPMVARAGDAVTGVRLLRRRDGSTEEAVDADLVVDATGRAGRSLRWLDKLGHPHPPQDELHVGVAYATRHIRLPVGALGDDRIVVVGPQPGRTTGMYLAEQEHGWWIHTVFGYQGHEPPTDPRGFDEFAAAVAPADIGAVLARAEPLSEVFTHRLPSSLRRRYERLRRFPAGFLVFGDAICSFNPIYGQGMTVAALQAAALRRELRRPRFSATRFFRAAARPVGDAWDLATGSDLSLPEVAGPRPAKVKVLNAYVERVLQCAERDATVSAAFLRTIGMLERPPALLRPTIALRVLKGSRARSHAAPAAHDPASIDGKAPSLPEMTA